MATLTAPLPTPWMRKQLSELWIALNELLMHSPELAGMQARALCRNNLFFLLRYGLNRPDCDNDWVCERCREVQGAPDGFLDLWAREHYKALDVESPVWTGRGWKRHGDLCF